MDQFDALTSKLRSTCPDLELREREPMRLHTSFRVGGPARLMALPKTEAEAAAALTAAFSLGIPPIFMGNGSDLLVADAGIEGFVLKASELSMLSLEGDNQICAGSGVKLARLAVFALDHALTGLEFAHGIPGTVGGAVTMDAGAYGGEMRDVVTETRYLTPEGALGLLRGAEHDFAYRHSAFSGGERLILSSRMVLQPGDPAAIRARMEDLAAQRREKQPLEFASAGSTFKRPEGYFAAALIDGCGLKGKTIGGAQVSERHAGFVINRGDASCRDILELIDFIRETVLRETGIALELEIKTLGIQEV
ncbi:MAG: UDP-N-acetylmuramate dehydrogenase [Pseudoflavonifractor sp.]